MLNFYKYNHLYAPNINWCLLLKTTGFYQLWHLLSGKKLYGLKHSQFFKTISALLFTILIVPCWKPASAQTLPSGFSSALVSSQWNQAVGLTFNKDGSQMFVWEKEGKVWVVRNNQKKLFIDISEEVGDWRDFGLLGFALDPHFETNGYFYLLYTVDRHHLLADTHRDRVQPRAAPAGENDSAHVG